MVNFQRLRETVKTGTKGCTLCAHAWGKVGLPGNAHIREGRNVSSTPCAQRFWYARQSVRKYVVCCLILAVNRQHGYKG